MTVENPVADMLTKEAARLTAIKNCAERLWPAVRFFGLCGANPEYVAAVSELGELLGKVQPGSQVVISDVMAKAKRDAVLQIAEAISLSPEIRGRIGRGACDEISQIVKGMKV